jgi:hypothetical protein
MEQATLLYIQVLDGLFMLAPNFASKFIDEASAGYSSCLAETMLV